jgi:hypothetical protein
VKVLVATKPVDFRNYVERTIMWSPRRDARAAAAFRPVHSAQSPERLTLFSIAISLFGARNRSGLNIGAEVVASASSFSVGSSFK